MCVLIVDDEKSIQDKIAEFLKHGRGFEREEKVMDLIYLAIAAVCAAISICFIKFCHHLMEDKS